MSVDIKFFNHIGLNTEIYSFCLQSNGLYQWVDKTPLSYFQWNEWHYPHNVEVTYNLNSNPYFSKRFRSPVTNRPWVNDYAHWQNKKSAMGNKFCGTFSLSLEILRLQPSTNTDYNCTASILGDMRRSDWIKVRNKHKIAHCLSPWRHISFHTKTFPLSFQVPCNCPLTSSWICEYQSRDLGNNRSEVLLHLEQVCKHGEVVFHTSFCLSLSTEGIMTPKTDFALLMLHNKSLNLLFDKIFTNQAKSIDVRAGRSNTVIYQKILPQNIKQFVIHTSYFLGLHQATFDRIPFTCSSGFFICIRSNRQCIAPQFVCDGHFDCPDGEDEVDCQCMKNKTSVIPSVQCLAKSEHAVRKKPFLPPSGENIISCHKPAQSCRIDNSNDTPECQAEKGLKRTNPYPFSSKSKAKHLTPMLSIHQFCLFDRESNDLPGVCPSNIHLKYCNNINCTNSFKCPNSYCIPHRNICDGKWDCPFGQDEEINCTHLSCPGFFHCKGLSSCIHPIEICDNKVDCKSEYQDDELMCVLGYSCPKRCICLGLGLECHNASLSTFPLVGKKWLKLMSLSFNNIPFLDRNMLQPFSHLVYLNLSHNNMTEISVDAFDSKMVNLSVLDITGNDLLIMAKEQFGTSDSKIKHLHILQNKLEEIHGWAFSGMYQLMELKLNHMFINDLKEHAFANITSLLCLNLSNNKINLFHGHTFHQSYLLSNLDITNNPIKAALPSIVHTFATLKSLAVSSDNICCLVELTDNFICHIESADKSCELPECEQMQIIFFQAIRFFLACSEVTSILALIFYIYTKCFKKRLHFFLLSCVGLVTGLNILLVDINNALFAQLLDKYEDHIVNMCNFNGVATIVSLHMMSIGTTITSIDALLLVGFPFRRKGLGTKVNVCMFTVSFTFSLTYSLTHFMFDTGKPDLLTNTVSYLKCVRLKTDSFHAFLLNVLVVAVSICVFVVVKCLVVRLLLIKNSETEKCSHVKIQAGIHSTIHIVVISLLWLPVLVVMALPFSKQHSVSLSNSTLMMLTLLIICNNVLFTFVKKDFRTFVLGLWSKIKQ